MHDALQADVVVIGAGLAGLAAACEAAEAGRRVIVLDQGRVVADGARDAILQRLSRPATGSATSVSTDAPAGREEAHPQRATVPLRTVA